MAHNLLKTAYRQIFHFRARCIKTGLARTNGPLARTNTNSLFRETIMHTAVPSLFRSSRGFADNSTTCGAAKGRMHEQDENRLGQHLLMSKITAREHSSKNWDHHFRAYLMERE